MFRVNYLLGKFMDKMHMSIICGSAFIVDIEKIGMMWNSYNLECAYCMSLLEGILGNVYMKKG
jgi:hypothetical protein